MKFDSILFKEGPIGRIYLQELLDRKNYNFQIFFLRNKNYLKNILSFFQFHKNNYFALKFLKDKELTKFINDVEKFFDIRENFLIDAYNFSNISKFNKIFELENESINSEKNYSLINKSQSRRILISGKEILKKNFFKSYNKEFVHIHPGYLPFIKGSDCSIYSAYNLNHFAASYFILNEKIDSGNIIFRKVIKNKDFPMMKNFQNYKPIEVYNIWHSFIDPLIRLKVFRMILDKNFNDDSFTIKKEVFIDKKNKNLRIAELKKILG